MINNLKSTIGLSLFCIAFSFNATAQTCATPPTCESLGYVFTESNCQDIFLLKCPFDTSKVYCTKPKCEVGYYAFTDGSCASGNIDGKTAIGIVFDVINRVAWHPISIFTGVAGTNITSWFDANDLCNKLASGTRLGTKTEFETWTTTFPIPNSSAFPKVNQIVWTASEKDTSLAWAYKLNVKEETFAENLSEKNSQYGVFCVKSF